MVRSESGTPRAQFSVSGSPLRLSNPGIVRTSIRLSVALVFVLLTLLACNSADAPLDDTLAYRSMWAELYPDSLHRELSHDTLQGAFFFAVSAESQDAAEERWAEFLSVWTPGNGEFEDAMHANLVIWAELEMQRLEYLKQNKKSAAEAVNHKLRDLGADFE